MATVYLARSIGSEGFERLVAVKCMHAHVAADREFVGMFVDEARLAARIHHPNVVATLDLGDGPDGLYLVMEYVEGETLAGLLRALQAAEAHLPPAVALRIAVELLDGLEAAHSLAGARGEPLNVVHRDVSPQNVLVGSDGVTRLTDFGIARAEDRVSSTRAGEVKG